MGYSNFTKSFTAFHFGFMNGFRVSSPHNFCLLSSLFYTCDQERGPAAAAMPSEGSHVDS